MDRWGISLRMEKVWANCQEKHLRVTRLLIANLIINWIKMGTIIWIWILCRATTSSKTIHWPILDRPWSNKRVIRMMRIRIRIRGYKMPKRNWFRSLARLMRRNLTWPLLGRVAGFRSWIRQQMVFCPNKWWTKDWMVHQWIYWNRLNLILEKVARRRFRMRTILISLIIRVRQGPRIFSKTVFFNL